ncbi:MAG: hypothetical protein IJ111_12880 [Eggerthellaceae bacterium]|nr:hypothetical protein [Eggerthellaceae bacterium]
MFEQDYLMKQFLMFFQALTRSWEQMEEEEDPQSAADTLENAISVATEMDGMALLTLAPESIASIMQVTGVDPNVVEYISRSMLLESVYLNQAGNAELASIRTAQAQAIADSYGFGLPEDPSDFEAITAGLEEAALGAK